MTGRDDAERERVFFEIHSDNPREAPGSREATARAFRSLEGLPARPRILDLGCGPGAQTLDLAGLCQGTVHAVDNHAPFIGILRRRAEAAGVSDRVFGQVGDMNAPAFRAGTFDLVWSEGAIYLVGFEAGLRAWKPLLRPGGCIAVTELSWTADDPPGPARDFWAEEYPGMKSVAENVPLLRAAGFEPLEVFPLSASDWLEGYAGAIEARLPDFEKRYAGRPAALEAVAAERREIEIVRKYSDWFAYVFYTARTTAPAAGGR
jgi:SAM-dependent methyltransferase